MKRGKKYNDVREKVDRLKEYNAVEAIEFLKNNSFVKFDETVEIAVRLGVDPRKSDQAVRGAAVLPNGLGKTVRVLVFAQGDKVAEAKEAGDDYGGGEDLAEKIKGGWLDFDSVIATPDMMKIVGRLGKILGTRGMMPNPKVGTVTNDVTRAVKEIKKGKVEFRVDKAAILHVPIGKLSFESQKILENAKSFMDAVYKAKPAAAKGQYVKKISITSTMGQGLKINQNDLKL